MFSESCDTKTLEIFVNNNISHTINVEVAKSDQELKEGLMHRKHLEQNSGMLFIFRQKGEKLFWMKNTFISLDIIFIDETGIIRKIEKNTIPLSEKLILGGAYTKFVLELNAGFTESLRIKPGHKVHHILINNKKTSCGYILSNNYLY